MSTRRNNKSSGNHTRRRNRSSIVLMPKTHRSRLEGVQTYKANWLGKYKGPIIIKVFDNELYYHKEKLALSTIDGFRYHVKTINIPVNPFIYISQKGKVRKDARQASRASLPAFGTVGFLALVFDFQRSTGHIRQDITLIPWSHIHLRNGNI